MSGEGNIYINKGASLSRDTLIKPSVFYSIGRGVVTNNNDIP